MFKDIFNSHSPSQEFCFGYYLQEILHKVMTVTTCHGFPYVVSFVALYRQLCHFLDLPRLVPRAGTIGSVIL